MQSLEVDIGVSWGRLELWSCQSIYLGFQPEYLLPSREVLLPRFSLLGESDLESRLYFETA